MLLAASTLKSVSYGLALVMTYVVPLILCYRIGTRKGYTIFWSVLPAVFFSWLGVLLLALMPRRGSATVQTPSGYHVPPGIDGRRQDIRDSSLYGKRRK